MHFEEADPIALHSVVAAAHAVLRDVSKHRRAQSSMVKPHGYDRKLNVGENFFKHADRDPEGRINIEPLPELTRMLLFDAAVMLQSLATVFPLEAKLYWAWYIVGRQDEFAHCGSATEAIIADNQHLRTMTFRELRELLRFQQIVDPEQKASW
jgi:hypothetical protein